MSAVVNDGLSAASRAQAHVFETSEVVQHMEDAVRAAEAERARGSQGLDGGAR